MNDVETMLRDSLREYGESITAPPLGELGSLQRDVPVVSKVRFSHAKRTWAVGTAAATVVLLVSALTLLARERGSLAPATEPAPVLVGTWQRLDDAPLQPRANPSVLWTGSEFIVWGGTDRAAQALSDGAVYNPTTKTWRAMPMFSDAQPGSAAVWAGDRMVVLAGSGGAAYDPVNDQWSTLPSLPLTDHDKGFSNAIYSGGTLLGLSVSVDDTGRIANLDVWTLDQGVWGDHSYVTVTSAVPNGSLVSVAGQFVIYSPMPTDNGFVLWSKGEGGWRYEIGSGWSRIPPVTVAKDAAVLDSVVQWVDGELYAVVGTTTTNSGSIGVAHFDGIQWSSLRPAFSGGVGFPQTVAVDGKIALLGINSNQSADPIMLDPREATATPLSGFPLDTTFEQGAAWSGESLLVWGGRGGPDNTSGDADGSAEGAIWTP